MRNVYLLVIGLIVSVFSGAVLGHGVHDESGYELARKQSEAHDFDGALQTLQDIVAESPQRGEVWLQIASLSLIQGDSDAARDACRRAMPSVDPVAMLACAGRIAMVDGNQERAMLSLVQTVDSRPYAERTDSYTVWAVAVAAELAASLEKRALADRLFERALRDGAPAQVRVAYADHLLATGRSEQALKLTEQGDNANLALYLRKLLAARDANGGSPELRRQIDKLDGQFRGAMADGDFEHAREFALFYLELQPDPDAALLAARENIRMQKEPEDAGLLRRARCVSGLDSCAASVDLRQQSQSD